MPRRKAKRPCKSEVESGGAEADLAPFVKRRRTLNAQENLSRLLCVSEEDLDDCLAVAAISLSQLDGHHGIPRAEYELQTFLFIDGQRCAKYGGYEELSCSDVEVQLVGKLRSAAAGLEDSTKNSSILLLSGHLDGPDSAISGLVHLIRSDLVRLAPAPGSDLEQPHWDRFYVLLTPRAFQQVSHPDFKKGTQTSMRAVMSWLRPDMHPDDFGRPADVPVRRDLFHEAALYDAIKPSGNEKCLDVQPCELLVDLRPYQRRAVQWMIQREHGWDSGHPEKFSTMAGCTTASPTVSAASSGVCSLRGRVPNAPLWFAGFSVDNETQFYYNPYSGCISREAQNFCTYVHGGILADEMGLGKTVEVLACILVNKEKKVPSQELSAAELSKRKLTSELTKRKKERVQCVCGAREESPDYAGRWVQCDLCDAWQHASCVGFSCRLGSVEQASKRQRSEVEVEGIPSSSRSRKSKSTKTATEEVDSLVQVTRDEFVCGTCTHLIAGSTVDGKCGATLIVCPAAILRQWQEEIVRHTQRGASRIMVYEGVQKGGLRLSFLNEPASEDMNTRIKIVGAHHLATSEIVLTTYDTLRADLAHDLDVHDYRACLRTKKRYFVVPTPLTRLKWRRVCLDEAQMVETGATRAAEMALRLDAGYRWCITGTPIQRGLDDLYGLLKFLRAEPFDDNFWWTHAVKRPLEVGSTDAATVLYGFLRGLMWRSSKEQVISELDIPVQEEQVSWLKFSPVESHFYMQQHEKCASKANEDLKNYHAIQSCQLELSGNTPLCSASEMDGMGQGDQNVLDMENNDLLGAKVTLENGFSALPVQTHRFIDQLVDGFLAHKILMLRQACCHPQVGDSGIRRIHHSHSPMTMDEIHKVLIDKARLKGEEAQRSLLSSMNGLAAVAVIEGDPLLAISIYREALLEADRNSESFHVDPLQELHILHNMADLLGKYDQTEKQEHLSMATLVEDVPRMLQENNLTSKISEIKTKYLSSFKMRLFAHRKEFGSSHVEVNEACRACDDSGAHFWWHNVLQSMDQQSGSELIFKISGHLLSDFYRNASSLALRFQDLAGLKYVLQKELDAISKCRVDALEHLVALDKCVDNPSISHTQRAGDCSQCRVSSSGSVCYHCQMMKDYFQPYETHLFQLSTQTADATLVSADAAVEAQNRALELKRWEPSMSSGENTEFGRAKRLGAMQVSVSRAQSETEQILQMMKPYAKNLPGGQMLAEQHLNLLKAMRKEYGRATALAESQRCMLSALDELNMAMTRLRLALPGEDISCDKLHIEDIGPKKAEMKIDKIAALHELTRVKGQYRYLQGLAMARSSNLMDATVGEGTQVTHRENVEETCPVCQEPLGVQLMVFPCGHFLCCKCVMLMVDRVPTPFGGLSMKRLRCPACRAKCTFSNVALVDRQKAMCGVKDGDDCLSEEKIVVKGSYGTKMEAVARRILWLKLRTPNCKVLVFSTWHDVLDLLEHALLKNNVRFARVKRGRRLDEAIKRFKSSAALHNVCADDTTMEHVQVLLLPIHLGANGLNLIEAQHVILMEPLLNPGVEAQAISRVHRIGQSQKTYVHRFIVKDTVEENIYKLGKSKKRMGKAGFRESEEYLTLSDLQALFTNDVQGKSDSLLRSGPHLNLAATAAEGRQGQSSNSA